MRPVLLIIFFFLVTICVAQQIPEKSNAILVKHLNLITGEEEILEFDNLDMEEMKSSLSPASIGNNINFQFDGFMKSLDLIGSYTQVTSFPESAIVYLLNDLNGLYYTGTLINPKYVITAGSDIYSARENLDRLHVTSYNYIRGLETRNITWATDVYFFTTIWDPEHVRDNIALVKLNRPIGSHLGYMGYGFQTGTDFYVQNNFLVTLIEEITYNLKKYAAKPDIFDDEYFLFQYKEFAAGAPFYRDNGILYGVNSFNTYLGDYSNPLQNGVTRITQPKFNTIKTILENDMPTAPDIMPLMVAAEPRNISAGKKLESISFNLHNYSAATFNGEIKIYIHLSKDNIVDDQDPIIETYTINTSMTPLKTWRLQPSEKPLIPLTIRSGDYFIGASINVTDANTSNNFTMTYDCDTVNISNMYSCNCISGQIKIPDSGNTAGYCVLFGFNNNKIDGIYDIVEVKDGKYEFQDVFLGKYILAYIPSEAEINTIIPTFYNHTAYWDKSESLTVILSDTLRNTDIQPIYVPVLSGSKFVTGTLSNSILKAGSDTTSDDFFNDVLIYLTFPGNDSIISFSRPDENGNYVLNNLENGNWNIDITKPGFSATSYHTVEITDQTDTIKNINFKFMSDSTIVATDITSVKVIRSDFEIKIYPNPASSFIEVVSDFQDIEMNVEIFTMTGMKLKEYHLVKGSDSKTDIGYLPAGTYIISVSAGEKQKKSVILIKK